MNKHVLAFHYAWYGTPWGPSGAWMAWNHVMTLNGQRAGLHDPERIFHAGERDIGSMLYPMDGPYDSRDVSTVRRQLAEAAEAGIDGFMLSWWGPDSQSDKTLDAFFRECPKDFISVNFETPYARAIGGESPERRLAVMTEGMTYLLTKYGESDRWLRIDGKPLMALWRSEHYTAENWHQIKVALNARGFDVFWLGQHYDTSYVPTLDALCTYEPFLFTMQGGDLARLYRETRDAVREKGGIFAATANPGFDNRALHKPGLYLARENGGYYRTTWQACLNAEPDFVVINSYNEWGESSVIESTRQFGKDYLELTREFGERFKKKGEGR